MYNPEFNDSYPPPLDYSPQAVLTIPDQLGPCLEFEPASESKMAFNYLDTPYNSGSSCCCAGDSQRSSGGSQLTRESNAIIEGLSRRLPYGPEEKKERIERYRSKRARRNFNKKIKYACRKTLADSRLRIRGRFARNDKTERIESRFLWSHHMGYDEEAEPEDEDEDEDDNNWVEFLGAVSSGNLLP